MLTPNQDPQEDTLSEKIQAPPAVLESNQRTEEAIQEIAGTATSSKENHADESLVRDLVKKINAEDIANTKRSSLPTISSTSWDMIDTKVAKGPKSKRPPPGLAKSASDASTPETSFSYCPGTCKEKHMSYLEWNLNSRDFVQLSTCNDIQGKVL